ncbi:MAG: hypothetical protein AAGJ87_03790 [Pseudomonadota bacterium]
MQKPYEPLIDAAAAQLRAARRVILDEMAAYPRPISGCDAQFNRLLSDRTRVSQALTALERAPFAPTPRQLEQRPLNA